MRLLHYVEIQNFKHFGEKQRIELDHPSVLIGPNNCGKTTAIQAIALWSQAVRTWFDAKGKSTPKERTATSLNRLNIVSVPVQRTRYFWHNASVRAGNQDVPLLITVGMSYENGVVPVTMRFRNQGDELVYCTPDADTLGKLEVVEAAAKIKVELLYPMSGLETEEPILQPGRIDVLLGQGQTAQVLRNLCLIVIKDSPEDWRTVVELMKRLPVRTDEGGLLTLGQVAHFEVSDQVGAVTRETGQRRAAIMVNLRGRDVESFVNEARARIVREVEFPPGYYAEFGGQFENLQKARARLALIVPAALLFIFVLIFMSFGSVAQAALIFVCVPLAVTGGIFALWWRDMPFTISAGVGFIALSGIAVLNGIMLISFINQLRREGRNVRDAVIEGTLTRLRPKLMTALVASLGFVPMAIATGAGAEVQRPLATVVIGGIITSTFLTLVVLPILYDWIETRRRLAAVT